MIVNVDLCIGTAWTLIMCALAPDEECGSSTEGSGWYGLMVCDPEEQKVLMRFPAHRDSTACILYENTQGFVGVTWYDDVAEARAMFEHVRSEVETEGEDA